MDTTATAQSLPFFSLEVLFKTVDDMIVAGLKVNNLPRRSLLTMTELSMLEETQMTRVQEKLESLNATAIKIQALKDDSINKKQLQNQQAIEVANVNMFCKNIPLVVEDLHKMLTTLYEVQKHFFFSLEELIHLRMQPWIQTGNVYNSSYKELIREVLHFYSTILVPFERSISPINKNSHIFDVYPCELRTPHMLKMLFLGNPPETMPSQDIVATFLANAIRRVPTIAAPEEEKQRKQGAVDRDSLCFMKDMFAGLCYGTFMFLALPSDHCTKDNVTDKEIYEFYMMDSEDGDESSVPIDLSKAHISLTTRRYETMVHYALGYELREAHAKLIADVKEVVKSWNVNASSDDAPGRACFVESDHNIKELTDQLRNLEMSLSERQSQAKDLMVIEKQKNTEKESVVGADGDNSSSTWQAAYDMLSELNTKSTIKNLENLIDCYDKSMHDIDGNDEQYYSKTAERYTEDIQTLESLLKSYSKTIVSILERWSFCLLFENDKVKLDVLERVQKSYRSSAGSDRNSVKWHLGLLELEELCKTKLMRRVIGLDMPSKNEDILTQKTFSTRFLKALYKRESEEVEEKPNSLANEMVKSHSSQALKNYLVGLGLSKKPSHGIFSCLEKEENERFEEIPDKAAVDMKVVMAEEGSHSPFYKVNVILETLGEEMIYLQHPCIFNLNILSQLLDTFNVDDMNSLVPFKPFHDETQFVRERFGSLLEERVEGRAKQAMFRKCLDQCDFLSTQGGFHLFLKDRCTSLVLCSKDFLIANFQMRESKKLEGISQRNCVQTRTEIEWLVDNNGAKNANLFLSDLLKELDQRSELPTEPLEQTETATTTTTTIVTDATKPEMEVEDDSPQEEKVEDLKPTTMQNWRVAIVEYALQISVGESLQNSLLEYVKTLSI